MPKLSFRLGPAFISFAKLSFRFVGRCKKSGQYEPIYAKNVRNLCVLEQNLKIFALRAQTRLPLQRTPTYTQPRQPCTIGFVCVSPPLPGVFRFVFRFVGHGLRRVISFRLGARDVTKRKKVSAGS